MESLLKLFKDRLPNQSYYNIDIDVDNLFLVNSNYSNRNCREFIEKHFTFGHKEGVFDVEFKSEYEESGKHTHTTSLYLLGLLFQPLFYTRIKNDLNKRGINHNNWYDENDLVSVY